MSPSDPTQHPAEYSLPPAARLLLEDLGLSIDNVLKRAGLPGDLFARVRVSLARDELLRAVAGDSR